MEWWKFMRKLSNVILSVGFVLLVASSMMGCAPTENVKKEESDTRSAEMLHKHEKTFNPADYDPEIPFEVQEEKQKPQQPEESPALSEEVAFVSGFRVQVTFTDNIDQANIVKDQVVPLVGDQNVYVVYEAPYYKVRVGDFLSRPDANGTLNILFQYGYKDSWIVPDKVKRR